jgi:NAD(P)H-hydrate epimerase
MPSPASHCVLRRDDVRALDAHTIESGTPGIELMERAGAAIARSVETFHAQRGDPAAPGRAPAVLILAGSGNNGGDGYVVARLLAGLGWSATVAAVGRPPAETGDAGANRKRWLDEGGALLESAHEIAAAIASAGAIPGRRFDIILDALLGTGLDREVGAPYRDVIDQTNGAGARVVAVDIPSGLCADTGNPLGTAVRASHTVTIGAAKPGLFLAKGPDFCGSIEVVDIGLSAPESANVAPLGRALTAASVGPAVPIRARTAHKGDGGHVLIVGGSLGKTGAVLLAARGALRSGAGLVSVAVPSTLAKTTDAALWEAMVIELPDDGRGHVGASAWAAVSSRIANFSAVVIGPGLATGPGARELVFDAVRGARCPLVVDADGLNVLAEDVDATNAAIAERRRTGHGGLVLTPHPGEMARLLGSSSAAIQGDRVAAVRTWLGGRESATLVLKGAATLVGNGERLAFNTSGNPGMAAAGMGDVLSGITGAFAAVVEDPFEAACLAVFVHGAAGDAVERDFDGPGFFASEVADAVPEELAALRNVGGRP